MGSASQGEKPWNRAEIARKKGTTTANRTSLEHRGGKENGRRHVAGLEVELH